MKLEAWKSLTRSLLRCHAIGPLDEIGLGKVYVRRDGTPMHRRALRFYLPAEDFERLELEPTATPAARFLNERLQPYLTARGIRPDAVDMRLDERERKVIVDILGWQPETEGWDADGAPTSQWPT